MSRINDMALRDNDRTKILGTQRGEDMDYIPGYDDGDEPRNPHHFTPSPHIEEYDIANDR